MLANKWNNNNHPTAQTSSTTIGNILTPHQALYLKYEEIEKNYFSLLNTSILSRGTNSSLQYSLRPIPPTDTKDILQTLLKFVKRVDLKPIMPYLSEENQTLFTTKYALISGLETTADTVTIMTALSDSW